MNAADITPERALALFRPVVENFAETEPMLLLVDSGGVHVAQLHNRDIQHVLAWLDDHWPAATERPTALVLTGESWLSVHSPETVALAQVIAPADDPDRLEAVMACYVDRDGKRWQASQVFRRTPAGVEWDEPDIFEGDDIGGVVPVLLAQLLAPCSECAAVIGHASQCSRWAGVPAAGSGPEGGS